LVPPDKPYGSLAALLKAEIGLHEMMHAREGNAGRRELLCCLATDMRRLSGRTGMTLGWFASSGGTPAGMEEAIPHPLLIPNGQASRGMAHPSGSHRSDPRC
jgi:hypothetical protein